MNASEMRPFSIDDAMALPKLTADLYVKLSDVKFILVAKAGLANPAEYLAKFKLKNVHYLWVRAEDFTKVAHQSITVASLVVGQKRIADESKIAVLGDATAAVFREAETVGFNETTFVHAKMVVEATMQLASTQPTFGSLMDKIAQLPAGASRHSMSVSLVATMIGVGHDWVKASTLEKLALGGMLHDIGKLSLPKDLLEKPMDRMSRDEQTIYKSHPEIGRETLMQVKNVPDDVILMVAEHHEFSDGTGYPKGLKDFQISPLARVVSLANAFVELMEESEAANGQPRTAKRIVEDIESSRVGKFNRDALKALRKMAFKDAEKAA